MNKMNVTYHRVSTDRELLEILDLQKQNLQQALTNKASLQEGFVTVNHSFEVLKRMNDKCAHCIAKHNGKVMGYALCMLN